MKKVIIIIIGIALIAGGAVGSYFFLGKDKEEKPAVEKKADNWNPYSTENNHHVKLGEYLLSAAGGEFVVKMNLTLDLKDKEAKYKFEGLNEAPVEEEEAGGHSSSDEEVTQTPMQTIINSKINTYMLSVSEEIIKDKNKLEQGIKDELNKQLNIGDDFIKNVYIENLVIQ